MAATFSDANWTSLGGIAGVGDAVASGVPGLATGVGAVALDGQGNVYVGGSFGIAGDIFASKIAKWDGSRWSALGSGISAPYDAQYHGGTVNALAVSGTNLFVGGVFTSAGGVAAANIAKWDGTGWSALGSGMNSNVLALAVSGNDLYAAGWFTSAGGIPAMNVAKWNGTTWSALGSGIEGSTGWSGPRALAVSGSNLYVGGNFNRAGGIPVNNIAKWTGTSWSALGSGVENLAFDAHINGVHALTVLGTDLYVGGQFTTAGGTGATNIAKWTGNSWSPLSLGMDNRVLALAVMGDQLLAGGEFASAAGAPANGIAKWDGSSWSGVPGLTGYGWWVGALAAAGTNFYAGGSLGTIGGIGAAGIAKWNGSEWSALASGTELGTVQALAFAGAELYAAGEFTTPRGVKRVAKWNGTEWLGLGSGIDGSAYAIAVSGSDVYVGGYFLRAGEVSTKSIAKWNGSSWSPLGSGIHNGFDPIGLGDVYDLAVSGHNLYVGGNFTGAGESAASNIAMWNGSSWQALGSGVNGPVFAVAVSGTNVYAGGWFDIAGEGPANSIAVWNGHSWSALGTGLLGDVEPTDLGAVSGLVVSGNTLYVGGLFKTAGGVTVNNVAAWDGNSWEALGLGTGGYYPAVSALAVAYGDLYIGGGFTSAGGVPATSIAKWDGSRWSALGSGTAPLSMAVMGNHLYLGGNFTAAGGKVAFGIAKVRINSAAESIMASNGTGHIQFSGVTGYGYDVQRTTSLVPPILWTTVSFIPLSPGDDGSFSFNDTTAPGGAAYYRAVQR